MTAVDHAELKRLAEGATPGPWQNGIEDLEGIVAPQNPGLGNVVCIPPKRNMYLSLEAWPDNAAFIAAANPAVVKALIADNEAKDAEIEGLRAERDGERLNYDGALSDIDSLLRVLIRRINGEADLASAAEWVRLNYPLAAEAIRTQAPDSWRPIETAPKDGETVLIFTPRTCPHVTAASYRSDCVAEHWASVEHRWHFPGDVTHWMPLPAAPALRPQTAESGDA